MDQSDLRLMQDRDRIGMILDELMALRLMVAAAIGNTKADLDYIRIRISECQKQKRYHGQE